VVVRQGARWKIGSGFNIPIVSEPWIGSGSSISPAEPDMIALQNYYVGHLIDQNEKVWNEQLIHQIFANGTDQNIINTPLLMKVVFSIKQDKYLCIVSTGNSALSRTV
jgi:hypothetical protein